MNLDIWQTDFGILRYINISTNTSGVKGWKVCSAEPTWLMRSRSSLFRKRWVLSFRLWLCMLGLYYKIINVTADEGEVKSMSPLICMCQTTAPAADRCWTEPLHLSFHSSSVWLCLSVVPSPDSPRGLRQPSGQSSSEGVWTPPTGLQGDMSS